MTNVAADHIGESGVHDLETIADVKLLVSRAVTRGPLVVNAEDAVLAARADRLGVSVTWFARDPAHPRLARGGLVATVVDDWFVLAHGDTRERIAPVAGVPMTFGGAARHNVENVLAALPLARAMGLSVSAIAAGLGTADSSPSANPGRANLYELGGVRVLVDFAHNPHGQRALNELARSLPARRRLVIVGQAGDRDEASIRELARTVLEMEPDRIVVKEMRRYLRGRAPGVIPDLIRDELQRAGTPAKMVSRADTEWQAVTAALRWARAGDLLVLPIQADRRRVLQLLAALSAAGWRPGDPVRLA